MAEHRNPALLKLFYHQVTCSLIPKRPEWCKCQLKDLNLVPAKFKESFVTMGIKIKYFSIHLSQITVATMSSSFISTLELMSFCSWNGDLVAHSQEQSPCSSPSAWKPIIILTTAAVDPAVLLKVIGVQHGPIRHNPAKRLRVHAGYC